MANNNLGEVVKERRKARKLKLRQVAAMSGISGSHLGRIEKGERFPSGRILKRLAEPLGFTETELLRLAGFMSKDEADDMDRFKKEIKLEIIRAFTRIIEKIDSF